MNVALRIGASQQASRAQGCPPVGAFSARLPTTCSGVRPSPTSSLRSASVSTKNRGLRYHARLRDVEDRLATARWPNELRDSINELEALRGEVQALSRKLPLQQQQDVYHWRLHVSLILNEAVDRLGRMEAAAAR